MITRYHILLSHDEPPRVEAVRTATYRPVSLEGEFFRSVELAQGHPDDVVTSSCVSGQRGAGRAALSGPPPFGVEPNGMPDKRHLS